MAALKGLSRVLASLNTQMLGIEGKTLTGMIKASIIVRRDMEKTSPLIPVDVGNLRASWFVVTSQGKTATRKSPGFKGNDAGKLSADHSVSISNNKSKIEGADNPVIIMGFSANYAFYVHEAVGVSDIKKGKKQFSPLSKAQRQSFGLSRFKRPGSGAKFLEASLKRNKVKILDVIAKEAKIV